MALALLLTLLIAVPALLHFRYFIAAALPVVFYSAWQTLSVTTAVNEMQAWSTAFFALAGFGAAGYLLWRGWRWFGRRWAPFLLLGGLYGASLFLISLTFAVPDVLPATLSPVPTVSEDRDVRAFLRNLARNDMAAALSALDPSRTADLSRPTVERVGDGLIGRGEPTRLEFYGSKWAATPPLKRAMYAVTFDNGGVAVGVEFVTFSTRTIVTDFEVIGASGAPVGIVFEGLPLKTLDRKWALADMFREDMLTDADARLVEAGGADWGREHGFHQSADFNGDGHLDRAVAGRYQDLDGRRGTFLLITTLRNHDVVVAHLTKNPGNGAAAYLVWDGRRLRFGDCFRCDGLFDVIPDGEGYRLVPPPARPPK